MMRSLVDPCIVEPVAFCYWWFDCTTPYILLIVVIEEEAPMGTYSGFRTDVQSRVCLTNGPADLLIRGTLTLHQ